MRKIIKIGLCLLVLFSAAQNIFAKSNIKYVCASNAVLREKASTKAKQSCVLQYGTAVEVLSEDSKWAYVQDSENTSKKGWIPVTLLTKKKLAKNSKVSADAKEISLAAKGFSKNLEDNLSSDFEYDFSVIDSLENNAVSEKEVKAFMKEGKLAVGE